MFGWIEKVDYKTEMFTWSVQKVSRILNFRGLRVFDFRFLLRYVGTHLPHLCRQVGPF